MKQETKKYDQHHEQKLNNDALDTIAALMLIGVSVLGLIFWLSDMPY